MKNTQMKTQILGSVLLFVLGFSSVRADDNSVALEKLRKIPPAPARMNEEPDRNPLIFLTARGAFINHSKTPVPFNQLLKVLADLPKEAWPYGRAITFFPFPPGINQPGDEPSPADVKKVEADLKAAEISFLPAISA